MLCTVRARLARRCASVLLVSSWSHHEVVGGVDGTSSGLQQYVRACWTIITHQHLVGNDLLGYICCRTSMRVVLLCTPFTPPSTRPPAGTLQASAAMAEVTEMLSPQWSAMVTHTLYVTSSTSPSPFVFPRVDVRSELHLG